MDALSIAIIGAGGVGSTFGFQLAQAGHDVTMIARPGSARLAQLQRDGGVVRTTGARVTTRVGERFDEEAAYDLVIATVLAHQLAAVLPALQRSRAPAVHFLFNNLDPEALRDAIGATRASFGMPFVMATITEAGLLDSKFPPGQRTLHGDQRWADLFTTAGIPSRLEANMMLWLRCHVPMCVAFESISIAGQRRRGGATWTEARLVARGLRGGFAVVRGLGYELYPAAKRRFDAAPTVLVALLLWTLSRVTSFRTLLATAGAECRALTELLVTAASTLTLEAPAAALVAMRDAVER